MIDSPEVKPEHEEEQSQEGAIAIGKYQHCRHHDDGLLSTIKSDVYALGMTCCEVQKFSNVFNSPCTLTPVTPDLFE